MNSNSNGEGGFFSRNKYRIVVFLTLLVFSCSTFLLCAVFMGAAAGVWLLDAVPPSGI